MASGIGSSLKKRPKQPREGERKDRKEKKKEGRKTSSMKKGGPAQLGLKIKEKRALVANAPEGRGGKRDKRGRGREEEKRQKKGS